MRFKRLPGTKRKLLNMCRILNCPPDTEMHCWSLTRINRIRLEGQPLMEKAGVTGWPVRYFNVIWLGNQLFVWASLSMKMLDFFIGPGDKLKHLALPAGTEILNEPLYNRIIVPFFQPWELKAFRPAKCLKSAWGLIRIT